MTDLELHVQEPWLTHIESGVKTVEGRRGDTDRYKHFIGNRVRFFNEQKEVHVHVNEIRHYPNLYAYLEAEDYKKVVPGLETLEDAINEYHKFYSDDKIKEAGGMLAIEITRV